MVRFIKGEPKNHLKNLRDPPRGNSNTLMSFMLIVAIHHQVLRNYNAWASRMPQHLRTQNSNTWQKNTGHSNPATSESVTARKILDLWIILMKRKGVILLPYLFFPPIWLAKSSFMVAYVTPSWISAAPWPSLAISLVCCTNWQRGRTEAQEGVKHGNGNSPINGGFDGNIIYKWGNHKWWEFCWTIHDVSHELPSTTCPGECSIWKFRSCRCS